MNLQNKNNERTSEPVPRSRLDTRGMRPEQALLAWHENIDTMFDVRVHDSGEAFRVTMDAFMLGDLMLVNVPHVAAQSYERSHMRIGRDGLDHYLLQFYTKGTVAGRRDKGENHTQPGDLWITDLAQPLSSTATRAEAINLIVPRRVLSPMLDAPDHHSMRILSGQQPLVALFRNHLQTLAMAAPAMSIGDAERMIAPTLQLAAAALNGCLNSEDAVSVAENVMTERICRYVNATLPSSSITLEDTAARFGISIRKLSYLFKPLGGFAAWVRKRRLALVRAALTDPAHMHRTIDEITDLHGFSYKANLGRAFRDLYGLTPGQVRTLAKQRIALTGVRENGLVESNEWGHWISTI